MKDQIRDYEPQQPSLREVGPHRVTAWVGDPGVTVGSTLWIGNIPARVSRVLGQNTVEALLFDTSPVSVGDPVRTSDERAAFPAPRDGFTDVSDLSFEPGAESSAAPRDAEVELLATGIEIVDSALPLARAGVNIVFDAGDDPGPFERLVRATTLSPIVCASERKPSYDVAHGITWSDAAAASLALGVAANWAARVKDAALVVEAPPIDLDDLTANLAGLTVIARLIVSDGFDVLAETLDVGTVDCQIYLRPDGTIDFTRSHSRLVQDSEWATRAGRADEVREATAIFGTEDVTDEDSALVSDVEAAERALVK